MKQKLKVSWEVEIGNSKLLVIIGSTTSHIEAARAPAHYKYVSFLAGRNVIKANAILSEEGQFMYICSLIHHLGRDGIVGFCTTEWRTSGKIVTNRQKTSIFWAFI